MIERVANKCDCESGRRAQVKLDLGSQAPRRLTTDEVAALLRVKPQTVRAGLCNAGHYAGLRPAVKLPSRRLLWDAEQVAAVINI